MPCRRVSHVRYVCSLSLLVRDFKVQRRHGDENVPKIGICVPSVFIFKFFLARFEYFYIIWPDVKVLKSSWNFVKTKITTPGNNIYTLLITFIAFSSFISSKFHLFYVSFMSNTNSLFPIQTLILRLSHLRFHCTKNTVCLQQLKGMQRSGVILLNPWNR